MSSLTLTAADVPLATKVFIFTKIDKVIDSQHIIQR